MKRFICSANLKFFTGLNLSLFNSNLKRTLFAALAWLILLPMIIGSGLVHAATVNAIINIKPVECTNPASQLTNADTTTDNTTCLKITVSNNAGTMSPGATLTMYYQAGYYGADGRYFKYGSTPVACLNSSAPSTLCSGTSISAPSTTSLSPVNNTPSGQVVVTLPSIATGEFIDLLVTLKTPTRIQATNVTSSPEYRVKLNVTPAGDVNVASTTNIDLTNNFTVAAGAPRLNLTLQEISGFNGTPLFTANTTGSTSNAVYGSPITNNQTKYYRLTFENISGGTPAANHAADWIRAVSNVNRPNVGGIRFNLVNNTYVCTATGGAACPNNTTTFRQDNLTLSTIDDNTYWSDNGSQFASTIFGTGSTFAPVLSGGSINPLPVGGTVVIEWALNVIYPTCHNTSTQTGNVNIHGIMSALNGLGLGTLNYYSGTSASTTQNDTNRYLSHTIDTSSLQACPNLAVSSTFTDLTPGSSIKRATVTYTNNSSQTLTNVPIAIQLSPVGSALGMSYTVVAGLNCSVTGGASCPVSYLTRDSVNAVINSPFVTTNNTGTLTSLVNTSTNVITTYTSKPNYYYNDTLSLNTQGITVIPSFPAGASVTLTTDINFVKPLCGSSAATGNLTLGSAIINPYWQEEDQNTRGDNRSLSILNFGTTPVCPDLSITQTVLDTSNQVITSPNTSIAFNPNGTKYRYKLVVKNNEPLIVSGTTPGQTIQNFRFSDLITLSGPSPGAFSGLAFATEYLGCSATTSSVCPSFSALPLTKSTSNMKGTNTANCSSGVVLSNAVHASAPCLVNIINTTTPNLVGFDTDNDVVATIAPQGELTLIWEVTLSASASSTSCASSDFNFTNTAKVTLVDDYNENITANNIAQTSINLKCHDIAVTKTLQSGTQTIFFNNDQIKFGISISNGGRATAVNIPLVDQIPANAIPTSGTITVTCAPNAGNLFSVQTDCPWAPTYTTTLPISGVNAGKLSVSIPQIPWNGSLYFEITSTVNTAGGTGNTTNTASVDFTTNSYNKYDPVITNNVSSVNYTVVDPTQITVNKASEDTKAPVNGKVKYTITVQNTTNSSKNGLTIHDTLPLGFTYDTSNPAVISVFNGAINSTPLLPSTQTAIPVFGTFDLPAATGTTYPTVSITFYAVVSNTAVCGVNNNSFEVKYNNATQTLASFDGTTQNSDDITISCSPTLTKTFSRNALTASDYTSPSNGMSSNGIKTPTPIVVRPGEIFKLSFGFAIPAGSAANNAIAISDNLPSMVLVAPIPNVTSVCSNGFVTNANTATLASAGGTSVTITGLSLPAGGTTGEICLITLDVVTKIDASNGANNACSAYPAAYTNQGGTGGNVAFLSGAVIDAVQPSCLIVPPAPNMSKGYVTAASIASTALSVTPAQIFDGNVVNFRIRIINPAYNANSTVGMPALSGIGFEDTLPINWRVLGSITHSGCGAPTVAINTSNNIITISNASVSASGATAATAAYCYFDIPVTNVANTSNDSCTTNPVAWTNVFRASLATIGTQNLTTEPALTGPSAIKVNASTICMIAFKKPSLTKAFSPATIDYDGVSTLTFTVENPSGNAAIVAAKAVSFTDTLPLGLKLQTGASVTIGGTGCNATSVLAVNNPPTTASTIALSNIELPDATSGAQSCTFSVPVVPVANSYNSLGCPSSATDFINGASNITSSNLVQNDVTNQCLTVLAPPKIAVAKSSGTPTRTGSGTFDVTYTYTINNYSPVTTENITATNVQLVDNFTRTYTDSTVPTITLKSLSIATAPGVGSTCTKAAAYSAIPVAGITVSGSTALLAGTDSLLPTHTCVVTASITVDYGTAAMPTMAATCSVSGTPPVPSAHTTTVSQLGCNTAVVSTVRGTSSVNAGATIPDNPITSIASTTYPPNTTASDYSNNGTTVDTSTAAQNTATPTLAIPSWYASVSKSFAPNPINSNLTATVIFTITNTPGNPAQTGIGLVDTLGTSLKWTSASPTLSYSTGCSGPATAAATLVGAGSILNTLSLSGVAVASGTASCTVTVSGITNAVAGATNAICPNAGFSNASIVPTNLVVSGAVPCLEVKAAIVLGLTKSAPSVPLQVGVAAKYTLTVSNSVASPNASNGATVHEQIPAGLNYDGSSGIGWICSGATGAGPVTLTCTYSLAINAGANSNPLEINVTPLTGSRGTTVTNKASVDVNGGTAPNAASLCTANGTPAGCAIDTSDVKTIDVVKSVGTVSQVSATSFDVPYTITVGNKAASVGGAIATNFQVVENLATTFATGTPTLSWTTAPSVTANGGATAAQCALNTAFVTAPSASNVFAGNQHLSGGHSCTVTFVVRLVYASIASVPSAPQNNSAVATVYSAAPATAGANNTSTVLTSDTSSNVTNANAASLPSTMNGDTPAVTPVTFAGQNIGVTKSVGTPVVVSSTPLQVVFDIPYSLRVKNTGSATATNVQVIDRLHGTGGTYASANTVVIQGTPTISSPTAAAGCTLAATPYTAGLFTGMLGNTSLASAEMCIINFTARVTYAQSANDIDDSRNLVPSSNSNTAYASTATSLNAGGDVNAGGFVAPANGVVNDASSSVATSCVSNVAANLLCDPTTSDTPSVTTVNLIAPALGTAKRIVSNTQIGPRKYALVFELAVQNTGNATAYKVRLQDNLADVFGSNAVLSAVSTTSLTGAVCTANASYTGTGSATDVVNSIASLPVNSMCKAQISVTVDYGTNAVPASAVNNQAFATSVPSATDVNNGYTFVNGVPVLGNGCASGVTPCTVPLTADASDAGTLPNTNNATANGASSGNAASTYNDPTPIVFTTQRLDVTKSAGTPLVTSSSPLAVTFSIPYSIFIKNTGSVIANNVQLVDKLAGTGGSYAGASSVSVSNIAMGGSTGCTSTPTYDSNTGVLTAFAGNTQLPVGAVCIVNFTVSATYNQSAAGVDDARSNVPSTARNNSAYASTANSSNSGGTFNATTGVYSEPVDVIASDVSTSIAASCLVTATNVLPTGACEPNSTSTPSATPTVLIAPAIGSAKTAISVTQTGIKQFDTKYEIKLANTGNTPIYNVRLQDNLLDTFVGATLTILNTPNLNAPTVTQGTCTLNTSFNGQTNTDVLSGIDTLSVGATCTVNFTVRANFGSNAVPSSVNNQSFASGVLNNTDVNAGYVFGGAVPTSTAAVTDKSDSGTIANGNNPSAPGASVGNGATSFDDPTSSTLESQTVRVTKAKTGTITLETITGGVQLKVPMKVVVKNVGTVVATNVQVVDSLSAAFPAPATTISLATRTSGAVIDVSLGGTTPALACTVNTSPYNSATGLLTFMSGSTNLAAGQSCIYDFDVLVVYPNAQSIPSSGLANTAFASSATVANSGGTVTAPATLGAVPSYSPITEVVAVAVSADKSSCTSNCDPAITDTTLPTPLSFTYPKLGLSKAKTGYEQVGVSEYRMTYRLNLKNNGNVIATNVQLNDYLPHAYPSPATFSNINITALGCTKNNAYNGLTDSALLSGTTSLAVNATCIVTLQFNVNYPTVNDVPLSSVILKNSAYGSGLATANTVGYTFTGTAAAAPTATAPASAMSNVISDSGIDPDSSNDSAPGATNGVNKYQDPTPHSFIPLNTVTGKVFLDLNGDRIAGTGEKPKGCYLVQIYDASVNPAVLIPFLSAVTNSNGEYSIPGVGSGQYELRFKAVQGTANNCPTLAQVLANQALISANATGVGQNGTTQTQGSTNNIAAAPNTPSGIIPLQIAAGSSGILVVDQNLPIDPSGIIYNSATRLPIAGAVVTLQNGSCSGPVISSADLNGGSNPITTAADGLYAFNFTNAAAITANQNPVICVSHPTYNMSTSIPATNGYSNPFLVPPATPTPTSPLLVQANAGPPTGSQATTYYLAFNYQNPTEILHNHIPMDSIAPPTLSVVKTGNKKVVTIGETLSYSLEVKLQNAVAAGLPNVELIDRLPVGFTLIKDTVRVQFNASPATAPTITQNSTGLHIPIGTLLNTDVVKVTYTVRVGAGAQLSDGINRAQLSADFNSQTITSLVAAYKVTINEGVFTSQACIVGKVFVDCNFNSIQDKEEPGIPGVRLYMEDSTYFVTDRDGKFSYCGVSPTSHIVKVDPTTLPARSRLVTSRNRNLGDANSLLLDVRSGELVRADFIEGSCTPSLLKEVEARKGKEDSATQILVPKNEGIPDVHKTLEGMVLPKTPVNSVQTNGGAK